MSFEIVGGHEPVTVAISGELDISNVERLEVAMAPILDQRPRRLIVDVRGLRFADSSAIALWVQWASAVGEIELRGASPLLHRVIASMGLEKRLRVGG
jgi:anti-anti-sigma factor